MKEDSTPVVEEQLLTVKEAAEFLKLCSATVQRMARRQELPAMKIGKLWRFRKSDLDEWLSSKVSFFRHPCRE